MFLALIFALSRNAFRGHGPAKNAAANVGDILLQFPLYAGMMGIMTATGRIQVLSTRSLAVATPADLGLLAFLSAGPGQVFVPSGGWSGGHPGTHPARRRRRPGRGPVRAMMSVAYGDQWLNMIQPFWPCPLAIARAEDPLISELHHRGAHRLRSGLRATMLVVGAGA
ncbi:TIGR00366 family protein [Kocuria rhizophila]|nr:TIGR00366 family protein [Kocuria rhizophila]